MLAKLKKILKIDNEDNDELLQLQLDFATQKILNATYQDNINPEMEWMVIEIAYLLSVKNGIKGNNLVINKDLTKGVSSVKRGDTTITYNSTTINTDELSNNEYIDYLLEHNFKYDLYRWNKIRGLNNE